jgi:hypothetical protein
VILKSSSDLQDTTQWLIWIFDYKSICGEWFPEWEGAPPAGVFSEHNAHLKALRSNAKSNCFAHLTEKVTLAALIFQSTSVTKPAMNGLPFAVDGTEIEKFWPFFL